MTLLQRTASHLQQSSSIDQDERRFAGSERACLNLRRACFSFSLQTPEVFGSHKIEMMEERKQIKGNKRIIGLEFLMVAFLTNWVQREST